MISLNKIFVVALKQLELGSAVAVRLTKYTGKSKEFIHPKHFLEESPWFTKHLNRYDTVLDLGSGNGQNSLKAAKIANKVVGIEIDENLIKISQRTAKQKKSKNIRFIRGNLEKKLPVKNESFSKVLILDVLEHLHSREQILDEIHRVLKPQGLVFIGVPNKDTSWKKYQRSVKICSFSDPDHKIEFSQKSISKLISESSYKILSFGYGKYDTPFRGLYDIIGVIYLPLYKKISISREQKTQSSPNEASGFEIVAQKR